MMEFIQKYDVVQKNGKSYIEIYFKNGFIPHFAINDTTKLTPLNPILLEEPCFADRSDLNKLSIILNKFCKFADNKMFSDLIDGIHGKTNNELQDIVNFLAKRKEANIKATENNNDDTPQRDVDERINGDIVQHLILGIFEDANIMDSYLTDVESFILFINKKSHIESGSLILPQILINFESGYTPFKDLKYGELFNVLREVVYTYIYFFFDHFPSTELLKKHKNVMLSTDY